MKNKRTVLSFLIILLTGVIYFAVQALQKNGTHHANFSGEWKSKEPISMGGNIVCCFNSGDRLLAKTMKITEEANFLTLAVSSSFPGTTAVTSQEKLVFDGKERESQINHSREWGKKFTVKLSADRQTMTVNSIVHLMVPTPFKINVQKRC